MDNKILKLLFQYDIVSPEATLLRHNENRTYKVIDTSNNSVYLLRVHDPLTLNLGGIQHTRQGVESELRLLEAISKRTDLMAPVPVVNRYGQLVTEFQLDGSTLCCSLLHWIEGHNLTKEDLLSSDAAYNLGAQVGSLHTFFATYDKVVPEDRPDYGIQRTEKMLKQIRRGVELELFSEENFHIVEKTLTLIVDRLRTGKSGTLKQGIIHADLNMSNILVSPIGRYVFIDFCLFGFGYLLFDVAMAALNAPKEYREQVVTGYYGRVLPYEEVYPIIEGFMLSAVLGYYAFVMENEAAHTRIQERMPQFCHTRCTPFLNGESIFLSF